MAKVSTKNIAQTIHEITKGKSGKELEAVLAEIIQFLSKKRLLSKTGEILKKLEEIIDEEEGVVRANVSYKKIPTKKIADELEELLKKRYRAKNIIINENEDKKMLGGVKIEVGDEIIDLTLSNKLKQLQTYLITN